MIATAGEVEPNNFSEGVKLMLIIKKWASTITASKTLIFIININTGNFTLIFLTLIYTTTGTSPVVQLVMNPSANAGDRRDVGPIGSGESPWEGNGDCGSTGKESACNAGDLGSIPGLGRSPGEGKGYPLQYSGLENSIDCIVHGVAKSRTCQSDFHFHFPVFLPGKLHAQFTRWDWRPAVHEVPKSRTQLSTHSHTHTYTTITSQ